MTRHFQKWIKRLVILLALGFLLSACSSMNLFRSNQEDQDAQEAASRANGEQIARLETTVQDLQANQEDLKAMLDRKDAQITSLETSVQSMESQIKTLKAKSMTSPRAAAVVQSAKTPEDLYHKARNLLIEENTMTAAELFSEFIRKYPKNSLADNAVYWLGECYYTQGDYKKAITFFKDLENVYPKSEKVPDAILKTGFSYLSLDDTNRAGHFLKKVIKKYPFSPAAEKAQEKLKSFE